MIASELRIGNETSNGIVVNIFDDHFYTKVGDTVYNSKYHEANPVPLTEKLLLKFGFVKGDCNWFRLYFDSDKLDDSDCLTYNINSKMLCLESFYGGEKKGSIQLLSLDEKYIHQLQNLYFFLTGKELILNENYGK